MSWTWRACSPGDQFAIVPWQGDTLLPYAVAKVADKYEAWRRHQNPRGGWFGGEILSVHDDAQQARAACEADAQTPSPHGDGTP